MPDSWLTDRAYMTGHTDECNIFGLGRLLIWADLSLRHNGWAELIDRCLPQGLDRMRNEFDAKLEQQFSDASPAFAKALEGYVGELTGNASQVQPPLTT
jgi:hypothetical protein